MKKLIFAVLAMFLLVACGVDYNSNNVSNTDSGNVDNTDNSVVLDGNATYYNDGSGYNDDNTTKDPYFGDIPFDPKLSKKKCNDAGYFYCNIDQVCVNKPLTGGSCR